MKKSLLAFCMVGLFGSGAHAQSAGSWLIRGGITGVTPVVTSGNLSSPSPPGSQADVKSSTQISGGISYMLTDNIAVDVPLALPFRHDIVGAGALVSVGKVGDVKLLPVTVFAQYRFLASESTFRPYVALGLTYADFFGERGTDTLSSLTSPVGSSTHIKIDSRWGLTPQIGVVMRLNDKWFVDASVAKSFLKTQIALSTGQTLNVKVNPVVVSLGVGMRF